MLQPTTALGVCFLCVAVMAAETSGIGKSGEDWIEAVEPHQPAFADESRCFAHVLDSHASYGWRYPYAYPSGAPLSTTGGSLGRAVAGEPRQR